MTWEHTSNAPHTTQLWQELCQAKAERDRLEHALADAAQKAGEYAHWARGEMDRLRDAARAFLALLDRHQFSSVALRGPELDALREAVK